MKGENAKVLAVKHCPKRHKDWPEVFKLTAGLEPRR